MVFIGSKWFGDNNVNNYVKHLYTLGAMFQNNVIFIKFVKPKDIPTLYAMSDLLFVLLSGRNLLLGYIMKQWRRGYQLSLVIEVVILK